MSLPWLLILGGVVASWSFLTLLGGERQRKLQELDAKKPAPPAETTVGRQVTR